MRVVQQRPSCESRPVSAQRAFAQWPATTVCPLYSALPRVGKASCAFPLALGKDLSRGRPRVGFPWLPPAASAHPGEENHGLRLPTTPEDTLGTTPECDLLLLNGAVVTVDDDRRVIQPGGVAIVGERIVAVGKAAEFANGKAGHSIDCSSHSVLPGLVDGRNYLLRGLARGLGEGILAPDDGESGSSSRGISPTSGRCTPLRILGIVDLPVSVDF